MNFPERKTILSSTGAMVNLYVHTPSGHPRGVVQINHGLAEHAARYARFAQALASHDFATYAHDHRGHGHTKAPDAPLGSFGAKQARPLVIADVLAVHDEIARDHPDVPVIAFGHSMGALITMSFVQQHSRRIAGAAIWNGNFSAGLLGRAAQAILAWEQFRLGSDVPSRILPRLTFETWATQQSDNRTPFDWLSRDQAEVDRYVDDPLCGWNPSVGMWRGVFDFVFAGADDARFIDIRKDLPLHLLGGERDPATSFGRAVEDLQRRLRRMGFLNLQSKVYPETRHESLNELNRDIITQDFVEWGNSVVADAGTAPPA